MKATQRACRLAFATAIVASPLLLAGPLSAEDLQADGIYINEGNGTTKALVSVDGDQVIVRIEANGVSASLVHAQHIHGELDTDGECPGIEADADGDGIISTAEGVGQYGSVKVALTTDGDTTADSALALERFPVAEADGTYVYERTFEVDADVTANVARWVVIVHGVDLDENGEYDGDARSSLTDDLPLEGTMPATCGKLVVAQVASTPSGGVAAGAGGTAGGSFNTPLVATAAGVVAVAAFGLRRRSA